MVLTKCPYCKQMSFMQVDDTEAICQDEDCGYRKEYN